MATIVLTIFGIIVFFSSFYTVKQQNIAVIERFGKFKKLANPGFHLLIPFVDTIAGVVNLRVQQLDVNVETKTKDNVFVKTIISVQYIVMPKKVYEAYYKLESPTTQMQAFVFDEVRAKVPALTLDEVFEKKEDIAICVKEELQETMNGFGHEIQKVLVTDLDPDHNVKNAMNEINTAQRLRIAAQEKGEAEKILKIKQAEGEAEANILHGKGISGQRSAIIEGLSGSVEGLRKKSPGLKSTDIMSTILAIQYFDTLRDISAQSKTNTLFVSHSPEQSHNVRESVMESIFAASNDLIQKFGDDEEALKEIVKKEGDLGVGSKTTKKNSKYN